MDADPRDEAGLLSAQPWVSAVVAAIFGALGLWMLYGFGMVVWQLIVRAAAS